MAEDERIKKVNDLKIKRRTYTGYDDEEFEPGNQGVKRAVLAKYDEDIEGPKQMVRPIVCYAYDVAQFLTGIPPWEWLGSKSSRAPTKER
jgi:hypothetical protein